MIKQKILQKKRSELGLFSKVNLFEQPYQQNHHTLVVSLNNYPNIPYKHIGTEIAFVQRVCSFYKHYKLPFFPPNIFLWKSLSEGESFYFLYIKRQSTIKTFFGKIDFSRREMFFCSTTILPSHRRQEFLGDLFINQNEILSAKDKSFARSKK